MLDELLSKYQVKYEDLNAEERETLLKWLDGLNRSVITPEHIKEYLTAMKDGIEAELADLAEPKSIWEYIFRSRKDLFRRARLKNYMLLLSFLSGPEKAKQALERSLKNLKPKNHAV